MRRSSCSATGSCRFDCRSTSTASIARIPGLIEYLECVAFGANIYFQFAGYSSVAIGFALLLGFRIIENFDHPFLRPNISAFWRCWHISLSSWCRDYVYMPVAASTRSVALGAVASMVVIGLWHEISLRYLAWGLYHAGGILVWQGFQRVKRRLPRTRAQWARLAATAAAVALTFNFVMLSFAITKEASLRDAAGAFADDPAGLALNVRLLRTLLPKPVAEAATVVWYCGLLL